MIPAAILLFAAAGRPTDYFSDHVAPILQQHCLKCHNHELDDGNISFEDRETLLRNRKNGGPAIVPGAPEESALVRAIRYKGDIRMPPGKRLTRGEIRTLIQWVRLGAPWARFESAPKQ